ncbi:DUF72 domain-containing protein [Cellulomonas xiejunii]|uniref:DUF72 domain-containing protein n=1 Tax=Cellulomonas xiejunii TaxID=2968083 RepID=A0ABY5KPV1_9CELL|nr:DUF72 domain-containing protein [Cellulomonas xiejunii]MCC2315826.1 DUF72 domain-containing protein [Cellulomonas xiejunii]MCC2320827.1 DUF72 domain-containing protein [Cellulomonas xiejunii]UUI71110.1 DUF72 domain-containing protein [Cellulomonas xiejunii]
MTIRIGTSGWSYDHWDGVLYRPGLPARERLARYVEAFDTVELNASFYRWPREAAFASWRERLPEGFTMSVKAPRGLTHARRLYGPEVWSERIARSWHELRGRREALLVQLRPDAERDDARLDWFLGTLPDWVQVAVELRHPSWQTDAVFDLLARRGAAYCVVSGAGIPCVLRATSRLVYVRLHGPDHQHLYAGSYSDDDLRWWADRIGEWSAGGHDVVAYFNNDGGGHAVRNAWTLRSLLGA